MLALVVDRVNGPFRAAKLSMPVAGPGQVLVRVRAAGLNPLDVKIRAGAAGHAKHDAFPLVLGLDMAGVVEGLGPGVLGFNVGDAVYGMTGGVGNIQGSLAQYAAVDARLLSRMPAGMSFRDAAALPLAFATAHSGIVDRARLAPGSTVLVHGGAGGVGSVAVQLAAALGGRVFATASAKDADVVRKMGATPIDYRAETVEQYVRKHTDGAGFDLVVDNVGGETLDASFAAVKHFGHVVSALGWGTHALGPLSFREASYSGVFTLHPLLTGVGREHVGDMLRKAAELVEQKKLAPLVDERVFTLDAASVEAAYELVASRKSRGKVVVDVP